MAHYAFINPDTMLVVDVIVGRDELSVVDDISDWEAYYESKRDGLICRRTSFNTLGNQHLLGGEPFRYNYAGIGFTWDETVGTDGAFIPPSPYPSWVLTDDCLWEAPLPKPDDGLEYEWDEDSTSWVEVTSS